MTTEKEKAEAFVRKQIPELSYTVVCRVSEENPTGVRKSYKKPQLQHWLRVLAHIADFTIELYANEDECDVTVRKNGKKYCISINLTTGQPDGEENYKNFNEVVGV